ncbi:hypothetical protein JL721_2660 [Aureococcus anophagefferens]|nr:hypothetical protein JL721_2660 [Aureococcus anophagefferens]
MVKGCDVDESHDGGLKAMAALADDSAQLLAEARRSLAAGDQDAAMATLRTVLAQTAAAEARAAARARAARAGDARVAADQRALRSVAAFHLAMLLLARGDSEEADGLAWRFATPRLSDAVFARRAPEASEASASETSGVGAFAFDGALPDALFRALRRELGPGSRFWPGTYATAPGFFSYNFPLPARDPRHLVGRVVARLLALAAPLVPAARRPRRHFDMDETALRNSKGEDAVSPFASCVLFLDGDVDAPTLVVDRGFGDERFEHAGALCSPRANRLLASTASCPPRRRRRRAAGRRSWSASGAGRRDDASTPSRPTPNMAGAFDEPWCVARCAAGDDGDDRPPVPVALAAVAPVWARVAGDPAAFGDLARGARPWVGRYFLRNGPADIDDEVRAGLALAGD